MEERSADLLFQILDLVAQRRLANADLGGRPGEMTLFSDGQEIADVAQFHRHLQNRSRLLTS